jgi:hypothetical protein
MNNATSFQQSAKAWVIAGLVCISASYADRSSAQAMVTDPGHTIETMMGHMMTRLEGYTQRIQDKAQYAKELEHFQREVAHYQQQLIAAGNLANQKSMPMTLDFEERALDYGMEESCPSADGHSSGVPSLAQLWKRIAPDLQGDITRQQHELCQKTVLAQNSRFNEQVRMLKNIQKRSGELQRIADAREGAGTSQGKLDTLDYDLSQFLSRATVDMQYSESAMVAYDGLITSLNQDQQRLANVALGGKNSAGITQGVLLKRALGTVKQRER